jgi:steroid delta-isomerase-like uncharacterized protein
MTTTTFSPTEIATTYAARIWDRQDLTAIDDLMHPDLVIHSLFGNYHGTDSMRRILNAWLVGFPNLIVSVVAVTSQDDRVVIQWIARGTHLGEFKGRPPTGRKIEYEGVTVYHVREGKIVEYWAYLDMLHLLSQL